MKTSLLQNVAVAMVAASGTFLAVNPSEEGSDSQVRHTWHPDPATQIVNIQGTETFSKRSRDQVIYSVPADSYLVVTGFRREEITTNDPEVDLVMQLKNKKEITVFDNRMGKTYAAAGSVGISFPPESRIVLHRTNELSGDLSTLYMVNGYLVPAAGK